MLRKGAVFVTGLLLITVIAGCADRSEEISAVSSGAEKIIVTDSDLETLTDFESTTEIETSADSNADTNDSNVNREAEMNITITAGGHTIQASLYDNEAARQLWDSLPVTYPMMNLYGREMCYRMGNGSLPTEEADDNTYEVGDISYWPPAGSLVILYKQNDEVFEQEPIGHTDDDISFFDGMADTDITFSKAE